jgi:hypothetical protein
MWLTWKQARQVREPYLLRTAAVAQERGLVLVCESHLDAFFLRAKTSATEIKYIVPERDPFLPFFYQMAKYYTVPTPVRRDEAFAGAQRMVYVPARASDPESLRIVKPGEVGDR